MAGAFALTEQGLAFVLIALAATGVAYSIMSAANAFQSVDAASPEDKTRLLLELLGKTLEFANAGDADKALALVRGGADVNAVNEKGDSALTCAIRNGYATVARELIERGASVRDAKGGSLPLALAITYKLPEIALSLVKNGPSGYGLSELPVLIASREADALPLALAIISHAGSLQSSADVGLLAAAKAAGLKAESEGNIALKIALALLSAGADPHPADADGATALMLTRHAVLAKALLAKGARLDAKDKQGRTALMHATARQDKEVVEFLKSAQAA
jgi:ankyrin repeat protein